MITYLHDCTIIIAIIVPGPSLATLTLMTQTELRFLSWWGREVPMSDCAPVWLAMSCTYVCKYVKYRKPVCVLSIKPIRGVNLP